MIVDTHPHLLADDEEKYPVRPLGGVRSKWSEGVTLTAEEFLRLLDDAGVEKSTLVQASTVHGTDNSYCADSVEKYPNRFAGVACIDAGEADAPDQLTYWISERGMHGMRLFVAGSTIDDPAQIDDPSTFPTWDRARSLGIPVDVQLRADGVPPLFNLLEIYTDVPMILDHLAHPQMEGPPPYEATKTFFGLAKYPNLYLKLTSSTLNHLKERVDVQTFMEAVVETFGANRIMWGSNYPGSHGSSAAPYRELLDQGRHALATLSQEDQDQIFGGTAMSLYPSLGK